MSKLNRISCFLKCKYKEAFFSFSNDHPMLQLPSFQLSKYSFDEKESAHGNSHHIVTEYETILFNAQQPGFKGKISKLKVLPGYTIFAHLWYEARGTDREIHGWCKVQSPVFGYTHSLLKADAR